jgi:hypothetical protein
MSGDVASLQTAIEKAMQTPGDGLAVRAVCGACADAVPFTGLAVTAMTSDAGRETVFASDATVAAIETVQYGLGEGPSLNVYLSGLPSLVPDVNAPSVAARWPGLAGDPAWTGVGGVYCFPLRLGAAKVGVVTMYRLSTASLTEAELAFTLTALDITTLALLGARDGTPGASLLSNWLSLNTGTRARVHQATGFVMSRLNLPVADAFARLRALAYARGDRIEQTADDIIEGRLDLEGERE